MIPQQNNKEETQSDQTASITDFPSKYSARPKIKKQCRYLIIGAGWAGQAIALELLKRNKGSVIGFVDDKKMEERVILRTKENGVFATLPIIGKSHQLVEIAQTKNIDDIIIAVSDDRGDDLLSQLVKCYELGIPVHEMPDLYSRLTKKVPIEHIDHHWIVPKLNKPITDFYTWLHEATMYLISLVGFLCFFLPLFPLIALAIKIDSHGPVFYRQKRVGKNSTIFTLLKLRTMTKDADKKGAAWTEKDDARITRIGKFLRKYRLDELPQLINVLKGDMALMGPRPEAVELVTTFKKEIPFYEYRYLVKPGITGWAQVNYENTCSVEGAVEKLKYDLFWIKNRSFIVDLQIFLKSIKVMLTGFGAV